MAAKLVKHRELKNIGYELFIGALSILSILNLILGQLYKDPNLDDVLYIMNAIMTPIFLGDFVLSPLYDGVEIDLLLARLWLGRPAVKLTLSAIQDPACLPALARDSPL